MVSLAKDSEHYPNAISLIRQGDVTQAVSVLSSAFRLLKRCREPEAIAARQLLAGLGPEAKVPKVVEVAP